MNQTPCLKISCNASKTLPRPRPGSISRAAASSCLSWSWKTRIHIAGPKPHRHPGTDRPADRVPDGNGTLIAGQKLDGYRGASLCAGSRAAPPAPGFLRRGAGRGELPAPGERTLTQCAARRREAELEASVRTPSTAAGHWGWTSPDSVRIRRCVTVTLRSQQKTSARKFGQT